MGENISTWKNVCYVSVLFHNFRVILKLYPNFLCATSVGLWTTSATRRTPEDIPAEVAPGR